ncbi:hypothetical protein RND81_05G046800 [Saponaria officinalis]|uniref:Uncharacterized protein n=1 Tax=Saponaria officinalis TaxID=3572 RepID=A0AAW1KUQ7_SAPOF
MFFEFLGIFFVYLFIALVVYFHLVFVFIRDYCFNLFSSISLLYLFISILTFKQYCFPFYCSNI